MMRTLAQGAALQIPTAQTQNKVIIDVEKNQSMSFALPALKIHSFDGHFKRLEWRICTPFRTICLGNYLSHSLI